MEIAIVGYGYVGKAMRRLFEDKVVAIYDPYAQPHLNYQPECEKMGTTKEAVNKCDLVIVCVPTESTKDGSCDTTIVDETIKWLKTPLILIKSTVEPGTTERLVKEYKKDIAFSPEYIGEGNYFVPQWKYPHPTEVKYHTFQIFGGDKRITKQMVDIFVTVMGPHVFFAQTDSRTAEVVKYVENVWGAMKVTWANEMFDICEKIGVDYREMRELWALDSRTEKMHTAIFFPSRGFGGKCFPKDLHAFIKLAEKNGYNPKLLKEIWNTNARLRDEFEEIE